MSNWTEYGGLYNPDVFIDARNLAAPGWHVPTGTELFALYMAAYPDAGRNLKEEGSTHWTTDQTGANLSGLSLIGGGARSGSDGAFSLLKLSGNYGGINDGVDPSPTVYLNVVDDTSDVTIGYPENNLGMSARLIADSTTLDEGQAGTYTGNDGTVYNTICFNGVEYLAENLRETEFRTGATIPVITDNAAWVAATDSACCAYANDGISGGGVDPEPEPEPGYGVKYRIRFEDYFGNAIRYELLFPAYEGAINALRGSGDPLFIRCETADNNPFTVIKSKSAEFEVISMTFQQYSDIFDANHKIQNRIYINDNLHFQGWVLQEEYKEPYQLGRYKSKIVSVDGLALLRDIEYRPEWETIGKARWYGMVAIITVLKDSLAATGLTLPILDGNQLYEISNDQDQSALRQLFVNRAMFRDGSGYTTCYEAIKICLKSLCCRITQQYANGALSWLIEAIPELDEAHDVIVMDSEGVEDGTATIDDFVTLTGAKGSPLNVMIDHSAYVEITEAPNKLRILSDYGYGENLIKDYFDHLNEDITSTFSDITKQLAISPLVEPETLQGVYFNLGWLSLRKISTMQVSFNWNGMGRMRASLVLYTADNTIYYYDSVAHEFHPLDSSTGVEYYIYNHLRDPDLDMQTCRYDVDVSQNLEGKLVLILVVKGSSGSEKNFVDLDTISVAITDYYPKTGNEDIRTLSITNNKVREENIVLCQYPVGEWNLPGWPEWDNSGFPTYAMRNEIFIDDNIKVDYPTPMGFVSKGETEGILLLSWISQRYYEVYAENRFRLSGTILGQMNLTSIIKVSGRNLLIDSWNYNVKKSTHQVVLMEISKYDRVLATEAGDEIITEDGNNIGI